MTQHVPLDPVGVVIAAADHGAQPMVAHLACKRLAIVNVALFGPPDAGDRGGVLMDAGVADTTSQFAAAAAKRFGTDALPSCIVLTHGRFDYVSGLPGLAER